MFYIISIKIYLLKIKIEWNQEASYIFKNLYK